MDLSRPERALACPAALDVLMVLTRADGPLQTTEIARRAGHADPRDTRRALDDLAAHGLAVTGDGTHHLNHDHVLVMALEQLAAARGRVIERLRFHVGTWDPAPTFAAVVGSLARAEGGRACDVDLLLVRPAATAADRRWRAHTEAVRADVRAWTGNPAHLIEVESLGPDGVPAEAVVLLDALG